MSLHYWYMFPISILIATTAMASGVGGATFFSPFFILALGLSPEVAIGTGLITEVFGFASGLYAYAKKRMIDYRLGINLLMATIPMALLGTFLAGYVSPSILKTILGVGLFAIAGSFLRAPDHAEISRLDNDIAQASKQSAETEMVTADGEVIRYTVCNRFEGRMLSGLGGLFVGLISTGLGELNSFFLLRRCRVPSKISVGTSVFVVAITVLFASGSHFLHFLEIGGDVLNTVLNLVIFTVPGVLLGGQLGSKVASQIPQKVLERTLGILFILVAALTLGEVLL